MDANSERIAELEKQLNELSIRLEAFEAKSGYMKADEMVKRARQWTIRNPHAWRSIKNSADLCITLKKRFSIKKAVEELRESCLVAAYPDEEFKVSNSYSAVFARMLVEEKPALKDYVTLKKSKVDRYFS